MDYTKFKNVLMFQKIAAITTTIYSFLPINEKSKRRFHIIDRVWKFLNASKDYHRTHLRQMFTWLMASNTSKSELRIVSSRATFSIIRLSPVTEVAICSYNLKRQLYNLFPAINDSIALEYSETYALCN
ncbi:uncharacterized protein LOC114539006 isoform X3 [Dendronephthya gigantea]|uniref:uncharacterized protein LOC114539006 isoform X3 n=1 Tax=Dendronephthya gigantea TaxID=151771 RepID=UPI00106C912B|nr:uncharacterized protein LOC114539006 isoform X3 [Dendronephthya gigantea]